MREPSFPFLNMDMQEYQIRAIQEAVEDADSPIAEFLEHADVVERMKNIEQKLKIERKGRVKLVK